MIGQRVKIVKVMSQYYKDEEGTCSVSINNYCSYCNITAWGSAQYDHCPECDRSYGDCRPVELIGGKCDDSIKKEQEPRNRHERRAAKARERKGL